MSVAAGGIWLDVRRPSCTKALSRSLTEIPHVFFCYLGPRSALATTGPRVQCNLCSFRSQSFAYPVVWLVGGCRVAGCADIDTFAVSVPFLVVAGMKAHANKDARHESGMVYQG